LKKDGLKLTDDLDELKSVNERLKQLLDEHDIPYENEIRPLIVHRDCDSSQETEYEKASKAVDMDEVNRKVNKVLKEDE
jgi:hypothetical protein